MAATITSSGTWSALTFTSADSPKTSNERRIHDLDAAAIVNDDLSEINQFVTLVSAGYGISHQAAVTLLLTLLTAKTNREAPKARANSYPSDNFP